MKESDIQAAIMNDLLFHPMVAWCYVTSTGTFKGLKGGRPIKIGIKGLPDIIGQLKTGTLFGLEIKKDNNKPTKDQEYFIDLINKNGGKAGYCNSVEGALKILELKPKVVDKDERKRY